jgi:hypothetical protein
VRWLFSEFRSAARIGRRLSRVIRHFVPHQANARIIEAVAKRLGLDRSKVFIDIDRFGNTSAASIPIALCDAVGQGRVRQGDTLVFAAFGGGMTWARRSWSGLRPSGDRASRITPRSSSSMMCWVPTLRARRAVVY